MIKTAVLGIGNILQKDNGIGIWVINKLKEREWLQNVELVDGETSLMDMVGLFLNYDRVIIVDSLSGGYDPGTIYRLRPEQIGEYGSFNLTIHDVQLLDLIRICGMFGRTPEVIIIGVEPKEIAESPQLSPEMEAALPELVALVEAEVAV